MIRQKRIVFRSRDEPDRALRLETVAVGSGLRKAEFRKRRFPRRHLKLDGETGVRTPAAFANERAPLPLQRTARLRNQFRRNRSGRPEPHRAPVRAVRLINVHDRTGRGQRRLLTAAGGEFRAGENHAADGETDRLQLDAGHQNGFRKFI